MPENTTVALNRGRIVGGDDEARRERLKAERADRLREMVLEAVGVPDDIDRVDVKTLHTPNYFRINFYRAGRITDSFYVEVTHGGLVANPPLRRRYYDDLLASGEFDRCRSEASASLRNRP